MLGAAAAEAGDRNVESLDRRRNDQSAGVQMASLKYGSVTYKTGQPRVILITGTSSGIGLLTAVELATRGERVFASMRDTNRAGSLLSAAAQAGVPLDVVRLDVTSEASVRDAVEHVIAETGRLDVVVNNAALFAVGPIEFAAEQDIESIFKTNIIGVIRVVRSVIPVMRLQGEGRIVNVGSEAAEPRAGFPLASLYGASKAALHAFTLDVNKELAPLGIRSVLCEGQIGGRTPMVDSLWDGVAAFGRGGDGYARAEALARRIAQLLEASDAGDAAASMIADACTIPDPPVRYPPEAQVEVDTLHRVSDSDYLRLCATDGVDDILARCGVDDSLWALPGAQ